MAIAKSSGPGGRTAEQIREHYEIERELSSRLRQASAEDRRGLYTSVYDDLFRRVPHHPDAQRRDTPRGREARNAEVAQLVDYLRRFVTERSTYMEIGAGDCALAYAMTEVVAQVVAIDVSTEITQGSEPPENFRLAISDGTSIDVPERSIDLAFSSQLMEHLHPDDALAQLENIYRAVARGGKYICVTPNRVSGPHDVSRDFDDVATGFHLHEYSIRELVDMFTAAGFRELRVRPAGMGGRGFGFTVPPGSVAGLERVLSLLPQRARKTVTSDDRVGGLLGIWLVATK